MAGLDSLDPNARTEAPRTPQGRPPEAVPAALAEAIEEAERGDALRDPHEIAPRMAEIERIIG